MSDIDLIRRITDLEQRLDNLVKPEVGGVWTTWTPTITQSVAVGRTVTFARYTTIRNVVILTTSLAVTSAGTITNAIVIAGIPIAPANTGTFPTIGEFKIFDATVGYYEGSVAPVGVNDFRFHSDGVGNFVGITPNFALASGDNISFTAIYER